MDEQESRAVARLLNKARLPRMKTLDGFEFDRSGVSAAQIRELAGGDYVTRAEPVLLIGEAGTGKSHLATGLCVPAAPPRSLHHRHGARQQAVRGGPCHHAHTPWTKSPVGGQINRVKAIKRSMYGRERVDMASAFSAAACKHIRLPKLLSERGVA